MEWKSGCGPRGSTCIAKKGKGRETTKDLQPFYNIGLPAKRYIKYVYIAENTIYQNALNYANIRLH